MNGRAIFLPRFRAIPFSWHAKTSCISTFCRMRKESSPYYPIKHEPTKSQQLDDSKKDFQEPQLSREVRADSTWMTVRYETLNKYKSTTTNSTTHNELCKVKDDAEKLVVNLLSRRGYSAAEMRKKLNSKGFSAEIVEEVMAESKRRGMVNDSLYAETYSRSRWSAFRWGPKKIVQALVMKGVEEEVANDAARMVFGDGECNEGPAIGISKDSLDELLGHASKQWLISRNVVLDKRKARIVRWLQYRGFDWSVTSLVLQRLLALYPP